VGNRYHLLALQPEVLYLSAIYDLFNNEIVAFCIGKRNDLRLVLDTLKKAVYRRNVKNLLLHSNQGFQYTHKHYHALLKKKKVKPSMSRRGNCWDNACIESFFGHLKSECTRLHTFTSEEQLIQTVKQYIYFYNHERFQKKLNNLSPVEYRTEVVAKRAFLCCLLDGGNFIPAACSWCYRSPLVELMLWCKITQLKMAKLCCLDSWLLMFFIRVSLQLYPFEIFPRFHMVVKAQP
jgi:hypothetical protein